MPSVRFGYEYRKGMDHLPRVYRPRVGNRAKCPLNGELLDFSRVSLTRLETIRRANSRALKEPIVSLANSYGAVSSRGTYRARFVERRSISPAQFPLRVVFFSLSLHDERIACFASISGMFYRRFTGAMDFDVLRNTIFRSVCATYILIAIM